MEKLKRNYKNLKERLNAAKQVLFSKKFALVILEEKPKECFYRAEVWDSGNLDIFFLSNIIATAQEFITAKFKSKQEHNLIKKAKGLLQCAKKEYSDK